MEVKKEKNEAGDIHCICCKGDDVVEVPCNIPVFYGVRRHRYICHSCGISWVKS